LAEYAQFNLLDAREVGERRGGGGYSKNFSTVNNDNLFFFSCSFITALA